MGLFDRWFGKKAVLEQPVSPREHFTREVEALLRSKPNTTVRRGSEEFTLLITVDGRESTAYLANAFHDTREVDPDRRREIINRLISGVTEPLPEYGSLEEVRDVLAVSLRGAFHGAQSKALVAREFLPCLQEYLVIDDPQRISFCTEETASAWKTPADELLRIGRERIAATGARVSQDARGVFSVDNDDDYESARLLVPGFLERFRDKVKGRPIAVVPTRNQLYIAGDADPELVISLCELAEREYAASPRRVSAAMYTVDDDGHVVRYVREVKDDAARRVRASHVRFEGNEYSTQREVLDAQQGGGASQAFVASFSGLESKAGEMLSWAALGSGFPTWLPRTDIVALNVGNEPAFFSWDEVMRVAPHRLKQVPGLFPPRWETLGDFSAEEVAQMARFPLT